MSGNKGVIPALIWFREPGQTAVLPKGVESVSAAGDDLVGIALMADIEDDAVLFSVIDAMECQRQFHGAEIGCQVPAGFGYRLHQKAAQLISKLSEFFLRQTLDVQ